MSASPQPTHSLEYERQQLLLAPQSTIGAWAGWILMTPVWMVATIFAMGIATFVFMLLVPPLVFASEIFVLAGLLIMARNMQSIRKARASTILAVLEQTVRLNLPLVPMLEASARAERAVTRWRLERLATAISQGHPLTQSLAVWVPEMPAGTIAAIGLGERTGKLRAVLSRLLAVDRTEVRLNSHASTGAEGLYLWYPLAVYPILVGVMIFLVPKFRDIFADFRTPLPMVTEIIFEIGDWVASDWGWVSILPVVILVGFLCAHWWRSIILPRRQRFRPFAPITDALSVRIPFLRQLPLFGGLAGVFHALADQAAGHEVLLIDEAASIPENRSVGNMIERWANAMRAGLPMNEAARQAGLPRLVAGTLGSAILTGRTAEAFDFLARYYQQRFSRTLFVVRAAWVPGMTLFTGMIVAFVAVGLFTPLVRLIQSVSGSIP